MLPPATSAAQQRKRDAATARARVPEIPEKALTLPALAQTSAPVHAGTGAESAKSEAEGSQTSPSQTQSLPDAIKVKMEQAFGVDLSAVTLHTGGTAEDSCGKRGAVAFCQGKNIYLSSEAGTLESPECLRVIAHELVHVLQQMQDSEKTQKDGKGGKGQKDGGAEAQAIAEGKKESEEAEGKEKEGAGPAKEGGPKEAAAAKGGEGGAKAGGGANLEGEAHSAGDKAASGQKVDVQGKAPGGAPQNLDRGAAQAPKAPAQQAKGGGAKGGAAAKGGKDPKEAEAPKEITVPFMGRQIKLALPSKVAGSKGDFSVGIENVKDIVQPISVGGKPWRKSIKIPTGCFGLNLELGIEAGASIELKGLSWKDITLSRTGGRYKLVNTMASSLEMSAHVGLRAGVNASAWIAEAGLGLSAKAIISRMTEISTPLSLAWGGGQAPSITGSIEIAPLDLEAKFQGAAYVYFDAFGISTYEKEWPLYEHTLGKLSMGRVKAGFSSSKGGFDNTPEAPSFQNFEGKVRQLYPSKNR